MKMGYQISKLNVNFKQSWIGCGGEENLQNKPNEHDTVACGSVRTHYDLLINNLIN